MSVNPNQSTNGNKVLITNAALDDDAEGFVIVRGVVDTDSLKFLRTAPYQREVLTGTRQNELMKCYLKGDRVPDIELAVRHDSFEVSNGDSEILVPGPVWIVDGQQRVAAAIKVMAESYDFPLPRIGLALYFGTTEEWEQDRFRKLNFDRTKVSSDVLIRNLRANVEAINILYGMTSVASDFVLYKRVCWNQRRNREHLLSATTLLKTVGILMSRFGPGKGSNVSKLAEGLQRIVGNVNPAVFRKNVVTFFDVIEEAHGIQSIVYADKAPQVYNGYLTSLARVLAGHKNFWSGKDLIVSKDDRKRLSTFPLHDPTIANLAAGGGQAAINLSWLIVEHMNKGRTSNKLVAW